MANKNLKVMLDQSINQSNLEPNHLHAAVPGFHFTTKWWKEFDLKSGEMVVVNFCLTMSKKKLAHRFDLLASLVRGKT